MNPGDSSQTHSRPRAALVWVLCGLLAVAAFFLLSEHRAHFFGLLPYLLLLACPFLHFWMHGGHGPHGRHPPDGP
ncbi:MAG: DUF2933 domain-containing protein [Thermoanaerobaculia bacterium]